MASSQVNNVLQFQLHMYSRIEYTEQIILENTKIIHSCQKSMEHHETGEQLKKDCFATIACLIIIIGIKQWLSQYGVVLDMIGTIVFVIWMVYTAMVYFRAIYYGVALSLNHRLIKDKKFEKHNFTRSGMIQKLFEPFAYEKWMKTNFDLPEDCPICLEPFQYGSEPITLTNCSHLFHSGCLRRHCNQQFYSSSKSTCPLCRADCLPNYFSYPFNPNYIQENRFLYALLFIKLPRFFDCLKSLF